MGSMTSRMTPAEYGQHLATFAPPLTDEQVEAAARILASVVPAAEPKPALPELLTSADVAAMFGVATNQISIWRTKHNWPCIKVGRTYRFRKEDVDEILRRHLENPRGLDEPRRRRRRAL
jgi:hypothetical protein